MRPDKCSRGRKEPTKGNEQGSTRTLEGPGGQPYSPLRSGPDSDGLRGAGGGGGSPVAVAHVAADPARRGVARRPHRRPLHAAPLPAGGGRPRPGAPLRTAPLRDALLRRRAQPVLAGAPRVRALVLPLLRRRGQPVPAPPRARRAPRRALPHALQRRVRAAAGRRRWARPARARVRGRRGHRARGARCAQGRGAQGRAGAARGGHGGARHLRRLGVGARSRIREVRPGCRDQWRAGT
jgi:hypothetical protein